MTILQVEKILKKKKEKNQNRKEMYLFFWNPHDAFEENKAKRRKKQTRQIKTKRIFNYFYWKTLLKKFWSIAVVCGKQLYTAV